MGRLLTAKMQAVIRILQADCRWKYKTALWNPVNMAATNNTATYRLFSPQEVKTTDDNKLLK